MSFNYKKYLPHAIAIAVFAILTLIYFKPLLSGKELRQDDIARHKGMSKEIADFRTQNNTEPLWTNSMFGGMPAYQVSTLYPGNWLGFFDKLFKLFLPHPGGYLFLYCLGFFILLLCLDVMPWLALLGGVAYGLSSYFLIIIEAGHNSKANALGYLPALIGGVILLFRGRLWLGIAVTAMFTAMELNANHVQISYYGYILIAFIIAGYFFTSLKEKKLPGFFKALAFFMVASLIGLLPNAGSLLMTSEYTGFSTRGKTELTIKSNLKKDKRSVDQPGIETNEIASEPKKEQYERNTTTGLDESYATQWSYGIGETFTFLIPDFKGGASSAIATADPKALKKVNPEFREDVSRSSAYFGDQPFTSGPVYIGAIIMFLALLGMFIVKNPIKWPVFFATLLTIALGWGSNFMALTDFFMHNVPGYNKFRAVAMIMIVAELTIPLLAVLAVNELIKIKSWDQKIYLRLIRKEIELKKLIIFSAVVLGGFCLIGYLGPDLVNTFQANNESELMIKRAVQDGNPEEQVRDMINQLMPQIEIARKDIFKSDAARSAIFIGLAFLLLFAYYTNKIKRELFLGCLGLFIAIDLWTVDTRYLNDKSFITKEQNMEYIAGKTRADEEILADPTLDYRVLNLSVNTFNDASTSYYHKSVGGYHGAKLKKYQELVDFHLDQEIELFYKNAGKAFAGGDSATNALMAQLHVINMLNTRYFILPGGQGREEMPLLNKQANGNAWFIKNLFVVPTPDDEILGLRKLDTKTQAITTEKFSKMEKLKDTYTGEGTIKLTSYKPNDLVYETETKEDEFAVFSEIYYPKGWNAYVDGQIQPHISVNYVLRGMNLPAGKHKIEFKFEPSTYQSGNTLALIGSLLLLVTVGLGLYMSRKRNNVIVS